MDNNELLQKLMAVYCPVRYDDIDLTVTIQDQYVPKDEQDDLADDICNTWVDCNCTEIHNQLFSTLKTGNDILNFVAPN